jgi:hypothetical protein
VNIEIGDVCTIFVYSPWIVVVISRAPVVVVADYTLFVPLVIVHTFDSFVA